MATIHQINANRENSRKSTGPHSLDGKAASRMNALKSGIHAKSEIIRAEKLDDLETLIAEYVDRFHPATPEERLYVDTLIRDDWQLRRLAKVDSQLWDYEMISTFKIDPDFPIGHAYQRGSKYLERLQRRINCIERSYQRALHELERLQSGPRPDSQPAAQPVQVSTPQPVAEESFAPVIGFVPSQPLQARFRSNPVPFPGTFSRGRVPKVPAGPVDFLPKVLNF